MYEGYTYLANLAFFGEFDNNGLEDIKRIRTILERGDIQGGATCTGSGDLIIRILGKQAQRCLELCEEIRDIVHSR